jgi:MSHA biogenesis protein MshI
MSWFKKKSEPTNREIVGLCIAKDRLTICRVDSGASKLIGASARPFAEGEPWVQVLGSMVTTLKLKGMDCRIVLSGEDYKLLPAEVPPVPESEIDNALRWNLRGVLEASPQEMVVQSFPFPSGLNRAGPAMRHVVAARKSRIEALVNGVQEAGLSLSAIDIPELALRNIASRLPENEIGVALVSQGSRHVVITIYRAGELYVTRQLAGIASLDGLDQAETAQRLVEQLKLDLLRTLDYYDSQMQQRPPAAIYLQPMAVDAGALLAELSDAVRVPVRKLRFEDVLLSGEPVMSDVQAACLSALGGALRKEAV